MEKNLENTTLQEWSEMIMSCKSSGKPVKEWCKEKGIQRSAYYYWHKRVMLARGQELSESSENFQFTEIVRPQINNGNDCCALIECGSFKIHINNNATKQFMSALISSLVSLC